ncbi:MAG: sulfotransferase [Saprospiraceae bacterium]
MNKLLLYTHKLVHRIRAKAINLFAYESNNDIFNTILIIGSARSGTTFLMESINSDNKYRVIFEPFNEDDVKEWSGYVSRHYIDPQFPTQKEKRDIYNILSGNVSNKWVNRYNYKRHSDKRLIKAVRANLLIPYIRATYPDLKIIYITRNVEEVVASRMKLKFGNELTSILTHKNFLDKYYPNIDAQILKDIQDPIAYHTALWHLENQILIKRLVEYRLDHIDYNNIIGKEISYGKDGKLKIVKTTKGTKKSQATSHKNTYHLSQSELKQIDIISRMF